jgi:class 3 adenylate cyclase
VNGYVTPFAFTLYGTILCGVMGDLDGGYRYGRLGLDLLNALNVRDIPQRAQFTFAATIQHYKEPIARTLSGLRDAYRASLENGDFEFAGVNAGAYLYHCFHGGYALAPLDAEMAEYEKVVEQLGQSAYLGYIRLYRAAMRTLMGRDVEDQATLEARDRDRLEALLGAQDGHGAFNYHFVRALLAFLQRDRAKALAEADQAWPYRKASAAMMPSVAFVFWDALIRLDACQGARGLARRRLVARAARDERELCKMARHAPENHRHRALLVQAEQARVRGRFALACELYDRAIEAAQASGNLADLAVANDLAGQAWLAAGRPTPARPYLQAARYHYGRWGAHACARRLAARIGELPPLREARGAARSLQALTESSLVTTSSSSRRGGAVDLASVLKASQVLAAEIHLDRLLDRMMRIVIENAGAERGVLALAGDDGFRIEAEARADRPEVTVRQGGLLAERADVAQSVVNYVLRTGEAVLLDDALASARFGRDPHILAARPRSLLCFPLHHQGRLPGLLYLDNSLTTRAFTARRLEMLTMLAHEIVVALENARLYEEQETHARELEGRVEERTSELSRANELLALEKHRADALLLNVLPARVAEDLKRTGRSEPEVFRDLTVGFCDLVDFARVVEGLEPPVLIRELNELFTAFDSIVERHGGERIRTSGDSYMFACGAPDPREDHAARAVRVSLDIIAHVEARNAKAEVKWRVRAGLHSGPAVGGVVGVRKYAYDLLGATVTTAARMGALSEPMCVNVSAATRSRLPERFLVTPRVPSEIKGKGQPGMFFVEGERHWGA